MDANGIIHFDGTGNIVMTGGRVKGSEDKGYTGIVHFSESIVDMTIGEVRKVSREEIREQRESGNGVVMAFAKPESIDSVIAYLEDIKAHMLEGE